MKQTVKGEEIFESDPPVKSDAVDYNLSTFKDPIANNISSADAECIVKSSINPEDAFAVFNGKLFGIAKTEFSIADAIERRTESPLQRYARLRSETDELKVDLDSMVDSEPKNPLSVWSVLQNETVKLVSSLEEVEKHRILKELMDNTAKAPDTAEVTSSNHCVKASIQNTNTTDSQILHLENRIHVLETMLGYSQNRDDWSLCVPGKKFSPYPLVDTIASLEQRVSFLDPAQLDTLRTKSLALKADLDSALKTKAGGSTELKMAESIRKVEDLASGVARMESVVEDLPALVLRLKTLEKIHLSAGIFTSRLTHMESELQSAIGDLSSNREVLMALKEGFAENMKTMQQNVQTMDDRLKTVMPSR
jgi:hypothetical protein